jgi:hypothetical protein
MKKGCLIIVIVLLTGILGLILIEYISNKPIPIQKEEELFIGKWKSSSGFVIEIKANGTAQILENSESETVFQWLPGRNPRVFFKGDSLINLYDPFNMFRSYKINRLPYRDSLTFKMILNGVTLTKQF